MILKIGFQPALKIAYVSFLWLVADASLVCLARGKLFLSSKVHCFGSKRVSTIVGFIVSKYLKFSIRRVSSCVNSAADVWFLFRRCGPQSD